MLTDEVKTKEDDDEEEECKVKPERKLKKTLQEKFEVSDKCHILIE